MGNEIQNGSVGDGDPQDAAIAKFGVPWVAYLVNRPRLYDKLSAALSAPVTVISAPPGSGKTLLIASWLTTRPQDRPYVWLTLTAADDDPRSFWGTVATGLSRVVGEPDVAALREVLAVPATELPGRVAAAFAAVGPVVVVLDNLHELRSPAVHEGLLRLLDRPPTGLSLVVTSREDPPWPLDKLRLTGILREVGAAELAFRPPEAAAMLSTAGVELAPGLLAQLVERTEGWAAALRLAGVALGQNPNAAELIAAFSGDDHSVASYLLTEVLDQAAPSARALLGTICVVDLACADLVNALTDGDDGAAQLAQLEASNLFVHAVGRPGRWYQLHRLIADVLRAQLTDPRQRRDLYRRAAQWHRTHGMPLEAVRYALRGGLWRLAADIVSVHMVPLTVGGSARELEVELSSTPREMVWSHPELACGLAAARVMQGRRAEVGDLLVAARTGMTDLPAARAERTDVAVSVIDAGHARLAGDLPRVIAGLRRVPDDMSALRNLGFVGWHMLRIISLSNLGTAEAWTGEHLEAEKHLRAAIETERWGNTLLPHINAKANLALLYYQRGDLDAAEADALAAVDQANSLGWSHTFQAAPAYLTLAGVHLDRDDLDAVDVWLAQLADVEELAEPHVKLAAASLLAARHAATDDLEHAATGLRAAIGVAESPPISTRLIDRLRLQLAQLLCRRRDGHQAAAALQALSDPDTPEAVLGAARLYLLDSDPARAEDLLATLDLSDQSPRLQVAACLLTALAATARDDPDRALERIEEALLIAAPHRLRRPFLDTGADLNPLLTARIERGTEVAAFAVDLARRARGQVPGPAVAGPIEPLTTREQVVLRYLASTLSNSEIATELYVSVNTVKTHERAVYRKLGANGRRDAVRCARELRLL